MKLTLHDGTVMNVPMFANISGLRIKRVEFNYEDLNLILNRDGEMLLNNIYVRMRPSKEDEE